MQMEERKAPRKNGGKEEKERNVQFLKKRAASTGDDMALFELIDTFGVPQTYAKISMIA